MWPQTADRRPQTAEARAMNQLEIDNGASMRAVARQIVQPCLGVCGLASRSASLRLSSVTLTLLRDKMVSIIWIHITILF